MPAAPQERHDAASGGAAADFHPDPVWVRITAHRLPGDGVWYPLERLIYFLLFPDDRLTRAVQQAGPRSDRHGDCGRCAAAVARRTPGRPRTRFQQAATVLLLFAAPPGSPVAYLMARQMSGNAPLMGMMLSVITVLTATTLQLWLGLFD